MVSRSPAGHLFEALPLRVVKNFVCLTYGIAATVGLVYQKMHANFYSTEMCTPTWLSFQCLLSGSSECTVILNAMYDINLVIHEACMQFGSGWIFVCTYLTSKSSACTNCCCMAFHNTTVPIADSVKLSPLHVTCSYRQLLIVDIFAEG
ncbi:hypothetical protein T4C_13325 [Trichinella pseudospiralis]|uniref:Transmembrane protein n=1 Tax=Trichinella pseudospiralis TaxID=6337 RepID=A0A0V1K4I4_TRIPS|nr:hypothetical protein T4C_13325 [Trichinella pseudospiralis]